MGWQTPTVLAAAVLATPASADAITVSSTSYSLCSSGTTMADGSPVRFGSVASNLHPLGTRITLTSTSFMGERRFTVRDRIGAYSSLDFWSPSCSYAIQWGRRTVSYRLGWRPLRVKRGRVTRRVVRHIPKTIAA